MLLVSGYTDDEMVRLGADVLVRADVPFRIRAADLISQQARDCGMDLESLPLVVRGPTGPVALPLGR